MLQKIKRIILGSLEHRKEVKLQKDKKTNYTKKKGKIMNEVKKLIRNLGVREEGKEENWNYRVIENFEGNVN